MKYVFCLQIIYFILFSSTIIFEGVTEVTEKVKMFNITEVSRSQNANDFFHLY